MGSQQGEGPSPATFALGVCGGLHLNIHINLVSENLPLLQVKDSSGKEKQILTQIQFSEKPDLIFLILGSAGQASSLSTCPDNCFVLGQLHVSRDSCHAHLRQLSMPAAFRLTSTDDCHVRRASNSRVNGFFRACQVAYACHLPPFAPITTMSTTQCTMGREGQA